MDEPLNCTTHCVSCMRLDCRISVEGCCFVSCPNACGAQMHQCKVDNHLDEVCFKTVVPCPNQELGCSFRMERGKVRNHLINCPASVICCTVPCCLPNRHGEKPNEEHMDPHQGRSVSPFVPPISPAPPLPEVRLASASAGSAKHFWSEPSTSCSPDPTAPNKFVQQPLTPILCKAKGQSSVCDRLVPRAEASSHYRFHSDFLVPLNDSIELRCPLHQLGCDFVATRMLPHTKNHEILYNPQLDRFALRVKQQQTSSLGASSNVLAGDTVPCSTDETEPANLSSLPSEIMHYLGKFLDDVSLLCLSQTSERLYALLNPLLRGRMVVTPRWKRVACPGAAAPNWQIDCFEWSLPHRMDNIIEWHWSSAGSEIAAHLKTCPFNDIVIQDKPFCLTNGTRM